jgi:hypothetical protein
MAEKIVDVRRFDAEEIASDPTIPEQVRRVSEGNPVQPVVYRFESEQGKVSFVPAFADAPMDEVERLAQEGFTALTI